MKLGMLKWAMRASMLALTVAGLVFFIRALIMVGRGGGIAWPSSPCWVWLGISIFLGLVQIVCVARIFSWLVGAQPRRRVEAVFLASQLAKYVPGRVWTLFAQKSLLGPGVKFLDVLAANVVIASILLSSQLAAVAGAVGYLEGGVMAGLGLAVAVCLFAGATAALLNRMSSTLQWRVLDGWSRAGVGGVTLVGATVSMLVTSCAWISLFGGAFGYRPDEAIALQGVSGASFIAGMFSLLPAGLGLREGAFVVLGQKEWPLPLSDMMSLALVSRGWLLAIDVCAIVIGVVGAGRWRKRNAS